MMRHPRNRCIRIHRGNRYDRLPDSRAVPVQPLPAQTHQPLPATTQPPPTHLVKPASKSLPNRISSLTHLAVSQNAELSITRSAEGLLGCNAAMACWTIGWRRVCRRASNVPGGMYPGCEERMVSGEGEGSEGKDERECTLKAQYYVRNIHQCPSRNFRRRTTHILLIHPIISPSISSPLPNKPDAKEQLTHTETAARATTPTLSQNKHAPDEHSPLPLVRVWVSNP